jgi:hypothetical protein
MLIQTCLLLQLICSVLNLPMYIPMSYMSTSEFQTVWLNGHGPIVHSLSECTTLVNVFTCVECVHVLGQITERKNLMSCWESDGFCHPNADSDCEFLALIKCRLFLRIFAYNDMSFTSKDMSHAPKLAKFAPKIA